MTIRCRVCNQEKLRYRPNQNICKECVAAYLRDWNSKNRDKVLAGKKADYYRKRTDPLWVEREQKRGREFWVNIRREVIMAYGGFRCACCGETEDAFLTIDHVLNDGAKHRRAIMKNPDGNGKGGSGLTWIWLKRHGFPSGFQVLCMNCNFGKAKNGGTCPHHKVVSILKTA